MVLTILLITAVVITDIRIRRQCVDKQEIIRLFRGVVIRLCEQEVTGHLTVDEDTAQAGRVVITRRVVFSIDSRVENSVWIEVWHSVQLRRTDISEAAVNSPYTDPTGNLFVLYRVSAVRIKIPISLVSLSNHSRLVNLVINLCMHSGCHACQEYQDK